MAKDVTAKGTGKITHGKQKTRVNLGNTFGFPAKQRHNTKSAVTGGRPAMVARRMGKK